MLRKSGYPEEGKRIKSIYREYKNKERLESNIINEYVVIEFQDGTKRKLDDEELVEYTRAGIMANLENIRRDSLLKDRINEYGSFRTFIENRFPEVLAEPKKEKIEALGELEKISPYKDSDEKMAANKISQNMEIRKRDDGTYLLVIISENGSNIMVEAQDLTQLEDIIKKVQLNLEKAKLFGKTNLGSSQGKRVDTQGEEIYHLDENLVAENRRLIKEICESMGLELWQIIDLDDDAEYRDVDINEINIYYLNYYMKAYMRINPDFREGYLDSNLESKMALDYYKGDDFNDINSFMRGEFGYGLDYSYLIDSIMTIIEALKTIPTRNYDLVIAEQGATPQNGKLSYDTFASFETKKEINVWGRKKPRYFYKRVLKKDDRGIPMNLISSKNDGIANPILVLPFTSDIQVVEEDELTKVRQCTMSNIEEKNIDKLFLTRLRELSKCKPELKSTINCKIKQFKKMTRQHSLDSKRILGETIDYTADKFGIEDLKGFAGKFVKKFKEKGLKVLKIKKSGEYGKTPEEPNGTGTGLGTKTGTGLGIGDDTDDER